MQRPAIAGAILVIVFSASSALSQSPARINLPAVDSQALTEGERSINQLKRLQQDVITYGSLAEFEESDRLARVPLQVFERDLQEVTGELQPILARMPAGKLKTQIANSLACYRDGAYWWRKVDQPRVVSVAALAFSERYSTAADKALLSSIPYTVVINWRQAAKYLKQAEQAIEK